VTGGDVTVAVATLDRPEALARCLDALLAGTVVPAAIIVVDQGRDGTAEAVVNSRSGGSLISLHHVRQPRLGLSASRNLAIDLARSSVVAVTDDDCVPDAKWVEAIVAAFGRAPAPEAVTGRVLALPPTDEAPHPVSLRTDMQPADYTSVTLPWRIGTGANLAVRRKAIATIGGYDERLGAGSGGRAAEDLDLSIRLLRAGARIRYEPGTVVYHECQSDDRRMITRWTYGHGIGALAAMRCRGGDVYGGVILGASLARIARRLLRALVSRDRSGVCQAMLSLRGTARGVGYGWRVGGRDCSRRIDGGKESGSHAVRA
jgi:GT2 family glycosyltransferase